MKLKSEKSVKFKPLLRLYVNVNNMLKTKSAYQITLLTKHVPVIVSYIKGTTVKQQFSDLLPSK